MWWFGVVLCVLGGVFFPFCVFEHFCTLVSWFVGVHFLVDYLSVSVTCSSMFESLVPVWLVSVCMLSSKRHFVTFLLVTMLDRNST